MKKSNGHKKYLLVVPTLSGGSAFSARNLTRNLGMRFDILINQESKMNNAEIKNFFGSDLDKVFRVNLPFLKCYNGAEYSLKEDIYNILKYYLNKDKIYNIFASHNYLFIHLNSIVLVNLITTNYPMTIHIREVFSGSKVLKTYVDKKLSCAKGIVYIDSVTKKPFKNIKRISRVINNPFDQTEVLSVDINEERSKFKIAGNITVFGFAASNLSFEEKGLEFILNAAMKTDNHNFKLLIAGNDPSMMKKMKLDERIIYYGYHKDLCGFYALCDYIIRGDSIFAVGRTTYEALYSGCHVIVPGNTENMKQMFENNLFNSKIHFYQARNCENFLEVFNQCIGIKKETSLGLSNVNQYVAEFKKFINHSLRKKGLQ